jgi:hypothetical protein
MLSNNKKPTVQVKLYQVLMNHQLTLPPKNVLLS